MKVINPDGSLASATTEYDIGAVVLVGIGLLAFYVITTTLNAKHERKMRDQG